MITAAVRINRCPIAVLNGFGTAQTGVEICSDFDTFPVAGFRQISEKVKIQARVPLADSCIVISVAHIAPGMECNIIHSAFKEAVSQSFCIKILAHSGMQRGRVEVVEQSVFDLVHFYLLLVDCFSVMFILYRNAGKL